MSLGGSGAGGGHRVVFKLSMPSRASWNGGWSGEDRNYTVERELSPDQVSRLFKLGDGSVDLAACRGSWTHRWSDGWAAEVSARIVPIREALPKSDGFHGYEWMIENILATGNPYSSEGTT